MSVGRLLFQSFENITGTVTGVPEQTPEKAEQGCCKTFKAEVCGSPLF